MPRKKPQTEDICALYEADPEHAETIVYDAKDRADRRGFLKGAGLTALGAFAGANIPFAQNMSAGLIPAAFAQGAATPAPAPEKKPEADKKDEPKRLQYPGKNERMVLLGDKPLVAEAPEDLLDDATTPAEKFYIRNHGLIPEENKNPDAWTLTIEGEVNQKLQITLGDLKKKFDKQTNRMVLECAGNGRSFYTPSARGSQWHNGGVGCAEWTGVMLRDVLKAAGLKPSAIYTAHYGADVHLSGDTTKETLSRGIPLKKAMDEYTMLVWAMNGQPLPNIHGGPLRLVVPGYPGSASHKWLNRIVLRNKVHDGSGMTGFSYRMPIDPIVPGSKGEEANFKVMDYMPTRSIITSIANGAKLAAGTRKIELRGAAWGSGRTVKEVEVSRDFGQTWVSARIASAQNKYDWRRWTATVNLPSDGYYELWVRATETSGATQPLVAANWNPQGYGANPINRTAVLVG